MMNEWSVDSLIKIEKRIERSRKEKFLWTHVLSLTDSYFLYNLVPLRGRESLGGLDDLPV